MCRRSSVFLVLVLSCGCHSAVRPAATPRQSAEQAALEVAAQVAGQVGYDVDHYVPTVHLEPGGGGYVRFDRKTPPDPARANDHAHFTVFIDTEGAAFLFREKRS